MHFMFDNAIVKTSTLRKTRTKLNCLYEKYVSVRLKKIEGMCLYEWVWVHVSMIKELYCIINVGINQSSMQALINYRQLPNVSSNVYPINFKLWGNRAINWSNAMFKIFIIEHDWGCSNSLPCPEKDSRHKEFWTLLIEALPTREQILKIKK